MSTEAVETYKALMWIEEHGLTLQTALHVVPGTTEPAFFYVVSNEDRVRMVGSDSEKFFSARADSLLEAVRIFRCDVAEWANAQNRAHDQKMASIMLLAGFIDGGQ